MDQMIKRHLRLLAVRALGSIVIGIVGTALVGYWLGHASLNTWSGSIAMAIPTAVAFILIGAAMVIVACLLNGKNGKK
jgi:uncharacterized membrane protein